MPSGNVPTTPTSPGAMDTICKNESDCSSNGSDTNMSTRLTKQMSYDPTEYVQRARVTKAAPPKPAANPLQFVQIKPCNLYQSAQEQLKRAEQVKKVKEVVKEEPEDWQSNLDNWKTGRRKLVAPIIERVIETKKYESEDMVKNRKKSKTFSEMMEERGSKGRKCSLRVYNDDEDDDDLNGFGFSTNDTISGKSSVSEDYENQSVNSDNPMDGDKNRCIDNNSNPDECYRRDSISSPGFDDNTSNSTLSAASPDPAYSSSFNSSRIQTSTLSSNFNRVESWAEKHHSPANNLKPKPRLTPKIEGHLANYETKIEQDEQNANVTAGKIDVPKIDISSRRELFEKEQAAQLNRSHEATVKKPIVLLENESTASIKERLSNLGKRNDENKEITPNKPNRMSGDFSGARDRFVSNEHEQFVVIEPKAPKIDVPVVPLKERLVNLESSMELTTSKSTSTTTTTTGSSIEAPITKLENRARKMSDQKLIGSNDNDQHDEDSGINSDDLQSSLASQQSQPSPELMMNQQQHATTLKHNEPVPAARKPEVLPRRQITPDLVKTISNLNDDLLQTNDSIDDDADNSVSLSIVSPTALTLNIVNLTIKSVLVDSSDMIKSTASTSHALETINSPSSISSTSTTSLVMDSMQNASHKIDNDSDSMSKSNRNEHNYVDSKQKLEQYHNVTHVDSVESVLTNYSGNAIVESNDVRMAVPKSIYTKASAFSNNRNIESQKTTVQSTQSINESMETNTVKTVLGNDEHNNKPAIESIQSKNERIKCQIVGVLEKNKINVSIVSNESKSPTPSSSPISELSLSPSKSPNKSPSKTKNIFDFIKRNILNETANVEQESSSNKQVADGEPNLNKMNVPLNETNQKTEINQLLDEELDKLSIEETATQTK